MVGAPFWIFGAYAIDAWGIKRSLWYGGLMTFLGKVRINNR